MKVLILACLVALALARETVESLSSSEESITHVNKQKLENFKSEEQQQRENERQNKIHTPFQQQSLVYPSADSIPYAILPQNVLSLAQPVVVLPFPQPEIMEVPKVKESIFSRSKVMPFLKSPIVPFSNSQIQSLADLENLHFPQPLLQPLMHQIPQPLSQTPMLTPQPLLSIPQSKVLAFPQQVMPFPQRDMPPQAFLLYQEPSREAHPVTQPLAPVYSSAVV
uniref:Beta-casein n=1 Tax=Ailuropoda melanoleuca TaxID=9646 RepID=A0A7N5K591_AILME